MRGLWRKGAVLALVLAGLSPAAADEAPAVAVFDFELYDTSLEGEMRGPDPAEDDRLLMITDLVREAYRARDAVLVDTAALREKLSTSPRLYTCRGCETAYAEDLGADLAVTGFVQKISTLILSLNITVRDVDSGEIVERLSASLRGNTDDSWAHGANYLIRNELFADGTADASGG
ncbi:DUF3280 domain-containing protein [Pararhizobium haloflavum]|uniref:DUF3280 domain-containing protein n=1 Tax=Pararhizobium haloflavum TaxID=2037914 RepID=UPI001FE0488E|nr:DUF3280 domain-containing protein [Pararhizobium haloflavum]